MNRYDLIEAIINRAIHLGRYSVHYVEWLYAMDHDELDVEYAKIMVAEF